MRKMLVLFSLIYTATLVAQEATVTAGGNGNGDGGSVSYTVGQIVYTSETGAGGSVSQGVQQGYEIIALSGIEEKSINVSVNTYPNPVVDYLNIHIGGDMSSNALNFSLTDVDGRVLKKGALVNSYTEVDADDLSLGCYILCVYENEQMLKSFRIVKK